MRNKNRFVALVLSILTGVVLCGCDSTTSSNQSSLPSSKEVNVISATDSTQEQTTELTTSISSTTIVTTTTQTTTQPTTTTIQTTTTTAKIETDTVEKIVELAHTGKTDFTSVDMIDMDEVESLVKNAIVQQLSQRDDNAVRKTRYHSAIGFNY